MIPLTKPHIPPKAHEYVKQVLDSGHLAEGEFTRKFEEAVREYTGDKYAIAVANATVGLEAVIACTKNSFPGYVAVAIIPGYNHPAGVLAALKNNYKIIVRDVDKRSMIFVPESLWQIHGDIFIPVSMFGNPMPQIESDIFTLEDAACSLGSTYDGPWKENKRILDQKSGDIADVSVFSFHPRKIITTSEGGMITTNNQSLYKKLLSYKQFGAPSFGKNRSQDTFTAMGTNYRLNDVGSAIGLAQMEVFDEILNARIARAQNYIKEFSTWGNVEIPKVTEGGKHSYQTFCIFVDNPQRIIDEMAKREIQCQIGSYALHMHPFFRDHPDVEFEGDMKNSQWVFDHCLALPLYADMNDFQQEVVIKNLKELV